MSLTSIFASAVLATLGAGSIQAATVMDQIGTSSAYFSNQLSYVSQRFESQLTSYNAAVVDDFHVGSAFTLTNITAATLGYNTFTSYSNITAYEVNIYSSLSAAGQNINGDIFHLVLSPSQVSVTPFTGDTNPLSALVSVPVNFALPSAGTYYVSLVADLAIASGGDIGIYSTNSPANSYPDGNNAYIENPGGGFGTQPLNSNAAYKLSGTATVPDTGTTVVLLGMGVAALLLLQRKLLA